MKIKWLKYQHKHSSGRSAWQWKPLRGEDNEEIDDDYVRSEILPGITEQYSYSEKYSGVDYEIVDKAPSWVIAAAVKAAREQLDAATREYREWQSYIQDGIYEDCQQCKDASPRDPKAPIGAVPVRPCPTCGRDVIVATVPFWLMPEDVAALRLLGSLVEQGQRSVKSRKFRWPVEDKDEEKAYERLSKLGLAGGSCYQNTYEIHATEHGKEEWARHKKAGHE